MEDVKYEIRPDTIIQYKWYEIDWEKVELVEDTQKALIAILKALQIKLQELCIRGIEHLVKEAQY